MLRLMCVENLRLWASEVARVCGCLFDLFQKGDEKNVQDEAKELFFFNLL